MSNLEAVARAAVLSGGAELRRRFRAGDTDADFGQFDVKAAADTAAEDYMVSVIRRAFPEHEIWAEERGKLPGESRVRWIVDPLDGTNNFAAGLPTFTTAIAVLRDEKPELAVVYHPVSDDLYVARASDGIRYGGVPVRAERAMALEATTVATIAGREVASRPELRTQYTTMVQSIDNRVKRVCDSWAPTVHASLFARGRMQGVIEFHPDIEEEAIVHLFAGEAGAVTRRDGPLFVAAPDEAMLEVLWDGVTAVREQS